MAKKKKVDDDNNTSTTHKKVVDVNMVDDAAEKNKVEGYRLFDMGIFAELVRDLLCPVCCDSRLYVSTDPSKRKGLSSYIEIKCTCGYYRSEFSSPTIKKSGKGLNANTRSVYAMRSCGLGYNALEKFCGLMNLPPPVSKKNYQKLSHKIRDTAKTVAEASMSAAIEEVKKEGATDIGVSVDDGTWQRGGGVISKWSCCCSFHLKFKVVDVEAMSR